MNHSDILSNKIIRNVNNPYFMKDKFFQINRSQNIYQNYNKDHISDKFKYLETQNYEKNNINLKNKIIYQTPRKKIRDSLDVKDINNCKSYKLSNRQTNPLDPKYNYDWQMTEINENRKLKYIDFGEIANHPKSLNPFNNEKYLKGLYTNDIIGAQPGTKSHISKLEIKFGRKMNHKVDDIYGSHPGSLLKGIKTKRNTNPLNPDYPLIGGEGLEYGNEKDNKHIYDYNSLLDYYNKYSKITNPDNQNNYKNNNVKNLFKIKKNKEKGNIENFQFNNFRNKNFFYNLGNNQRIYPREQYRNYEEENL